MVTTPKVYILPEGYADQETAEPAVVEDFGAVTPRIIMSTSGSAVGRLGEPLDDDVDGSLFFSPQANNIDTSKLAADCHALAKKEKAAGKFNGKTVGEISTILYHRELRRISEKAIAEAISPQPAVEDSPTADNDSQVSTDQPTQIRKGRLAMVSENRPEVSFRTQTRTGAVTQPTKKKVVKKKVVKKKPVKKKVVKKKPVKKVTKKKPTQPKRFVDDSSETKPRKAEINLSELVARLGIEGLSLHNYSEPELEIEIHSNESNGEVSEDLFTVDWAMLAPAGDGDQLILVIDTRRARLRVDDFTMLPDQRMRVVIHDLAEDRKHTVHPLQAMYTFEFGIFQFVTMFVVDK